MGAPAVAQAKAPGHKATSKATSTSSALSLITCLPSSPMVVSAMGAITNRHRPHSGLHRPTAWQMIMATMLVRVHPIRNDNESHQRHNDGHGCAAIHKRAQQHAQQHRTALAVRCCCAILFPSYPYHTIQLTLLYAKCDGLFIVKRNKTSAIILPDWIFFINWQVCQTSFGQIVQHDLTFLWNVIKLMDLLIFHIFRFSVEFFSSRKLWARPALPPVHMDGARIGRDLLNLFIKI